MKTVKPFNRKRNGIPFFMMLVFAFVSTVMLAQTTPTVFGLVTLQKVNGANVAEYEKVMQENWKPLHQLRKQNGKITNWALYRVRMTGTSDEYNYASVSYYDSFAKTEPNDNFSELMKASNPKADAAAILARTQELRSITRQALYSRVDATTPKAGSPATKYVEIDFMKTKPGMEADYVKVEREEWKPVHQALVDGGKRAGWNLWALAMPAGTASSANYVTGNAFSSYDQIANQEYENTFKKVHAGKDVQATFDKTEKTRDLVKSELWELLIVLN